MTYHHAAAAAGLRAASRIGVEGCAGAAAPVLRRVLARQRDDGSFPHSTRDYRLLSDRRSYPRSQAMVLHHLLEPASAGGP
ncbi:MAG TPA: hypothetical protein VHG69_03675 [Thermoleophilaceae bacterium]|nr:hypothetical protein [Thermoleophilaceae bacterium]